MWPVDRRFEKLALKINFKRILNIYVIAEVTQKHVDLKKTQWFYPIILNNAPNQPVKSDATAKEC